MSVLDRMKPAFARLDGGLFSTAQKADVGDVAKRMEEQGVAMMSWADPFKPDPSTPQPVIDAAVDAIKSGTASHYFMPIGSPELKKVIAQRILRKSGLKLDPDRNLIINPGSDNGLLFAMFPWICPGDEVMVVDPSYPNNFQDVELLGGAVVHIPTYEEDGWHLRIEEFEKRVTDKTKLVVLTNPNNPTAVTYTRSELKKLAAFIIQHDLICVVDQAFEDCIYPESEMVNMAQIDGMWERTITVCSVSKGMGLSGFRVGWTYCDDVIMDKYHASAVSIQGAASTMAQTAVIPAFQDDSFIDAYIRKYDARRKYAYELFNSCPGVSMRMPEAGFYAWINVSKLGDSSEIVQYLIDEAKVNCNDGKFYGELGSGYLRLILAVFWNDEDCYRALDRMAAAFRKLAEKKHIS
ncbi:MAG: pyridoxal phosphate-dependent aminotransferase [Solobacterium sp.]|jgi:aspartate/methionine/tyrosine aminotransferase|nr:pyridoxal phosphate-dependent aminotransferase [Solobacterium sp.]MCH4048493.1 pyridoxal phosphate-dependent aminotransferase [Solobacterium sp.]MCH4074657.1 pyridoxal phosphate-dependent aminotransferase [Solobacterium sp.]MCI1436714.1 pyridoxal phosphate-dependent aminotransferase [Solobacterium sp.]